MKPPHQKEALQLFKFILQDPELLLITYCINKEFSYFSEYVFFFKLFIFHLKRVFYN